MCIFGSRASAPPPIRPAPVRRPGGPIAKLYSRRRNQAQGTFGNIFTSPMGVSNFSSTSTATTLGGTSAPTAG